MKQWFSNFIKNVHPLERMFISAMYAGFSLVFINTGWSNLLKYMYTWDNFAFMMIIIGWIVFFMREPGDIRKRAKQDDGSVVLVYSSVLIATISSIVIVFMLMINKDLTSINPAEYFLIVISGLLFSWILVHMTFTFHYARKFYGDDDENTAIIEGGLDFPGEELPGYLDFAYYSFVIGMTFQVSDVQIETTEFRKITLLHSMLSFILNTFVVAMTVGLITSFKR